MCDRSRSVVLKRRESRRPRAALSFLLRSLVLAALVWPIPALAEVHPSPTSPEAIELDGGTIIHLAKPTRDEDMIRSLELEIGKACDFEMRHVIYCEIQTILALQTRNDH